MNYLINSDYDQGNCKDSLESNSNHILLILIIKSRPFWEQAKNHYLQIYSYFVLLNL